MSVNVVLLVAVSRVKPPVFSAVFDTFVLESIKVVNSASVLLLPMDDSIDSNCVIRSVSTPDLSYLNVRPEAKTISLSKCRLFPLRVTFSNVSSKAFNLLLCVVVSDSRDVMLALAVVIKLFNVVWFVSANVLLFVTVLVKLV